MRPWLLSAVVASLLGALGGCNTCGSGNGCNGSGCAGGGCGWHGVCDCQLDDQCLMRQPWLCNTPPPWVAARAAALANGSAPPLQAFPATPSASAQSAATPVAPSGSQN